MTKSKSPFKARYFIVVALTIAMLAVFLTWRWFINPDEDSSVTVDAIVLFAGGAGERLDTALQQIDSGRSDSLITNPGVEAWAGDGPVRKLCADQNKLPFSLYCFIVAGDSTGDEAREFSRIARSQNFQSVLVVTGSDHLHRAEAWMRRCFGGAVFGTAAPIRPTLAGIAHEWGGMLKFWVSGRDCR